MLPWGDMWNGLRAFRTIGLRKMLRRVILDLSAAASLLGDQDNLGKL